VFESKKSSLKHRRDFWTR